MSHACRGIGAFAHAVVSTSKTVLQRTSRATATAALLGLAMSAAPRVVFADPPLVDKFELPLVQVVPNPCTGETVAVTGTTDFYFYSKAQKNGAFELTFRVKQHGTGIATNGSGATYTFHSEESTKLRDVPPGASQFALLSKTMLIRHGELAEITQDDFMMRHTVRIKIDDSGNVLVDRESLTEDPCAGSN